MDASDRAHAGEAEGALEGASVDAWALDRHATVGRHLLYRWVGDGSDYETKAFFSVHATSYAEALSTAASFGKHVDLRRLLVPASKSLEGANLRRADLRGMKADRVCMRRVTLDEAEIATACLAEADLAGATCRRTKFGTAVLRDANLLGANLAGADLSIAVDLDAEQILDAARREPAGPIVNTDHLMGTILSREMADLVKSQLGDGIVLASDTLMGTPAVVPGLSRANSGLTEPELASVVGVLLAAVARAAETRVTAETDADRERGTRDRCDLLRSLSAHASTVIAAAPEEARAGAALAVARTAEFLAERHDAVLYAVLKRLPITDVIARAARHADRDKVPAEYIGL